MGAIGRDVGRQRGAEDSWPLDSCWPAKAGDLHHRARGGQCRHPDDHARRQARQPLLSLNGRKHWITGGGVSRLHLIFARVFDERGGANWASASSSPCRRRQKDCASASANRPWASAACPRGSRLRGLECRGHAARAAAGAPPQGFADLMNAYNGQRVGAATVALGLPRARTITARRWRKARAVRPSHRRIPGPAMDHRRHSIPLEAARLIAGKPRERSARSPIRRGRASEDPRFRDGHQGRRTRRLICSARRLHAQPSARTHVRDARMFTIAGGTAQILRTLVASRVAWGSCRRPATGMWMGWSNF